MKRAPSIIFFTLLLFLSLEIIGYSQNIIEEDDLIKSNRDIGLYEVNRIEFIGNINWGSEELLTYITSKITSRSLPNKILTTYYNEANKNRYIPGVYVAELGNGLLQFSKEYNYFNEDIATNDVDALLDLYNTNGFHYASIYFIFHRIDKENVLTFNIVEGKQFVLASRINYKGLEKLSSEINISSVQLLSAGDAFNEAQIETEIIDIQNLLLRSGYKNSKCSYDDVQIIMDSTNWTDSVVVYFTLGERIIIGDIIFVDSTYDQQVLANTTKEKLIRIKSGDYYNNIRINRSIENLLSTGVFESVTIDTISKNHKDIDTVFDFLILSKYRKLREWDGGILSNQTTFDNLYNVGAEIYLLHRNMFGAAQNVKLFSTFLLKDISKFVSNFDFPDVEFRIEGQYAQPVLWIIENTRVSLSASLAYSYEILNALFKISKISFPVSFPARLPWTNYFSNINFQFEVNRETPLNYDAVENFALDSAKTLQDSTNIRSSLTLYKNINNYLKESQTHIFTSNLISAGITGDDRDNIFSPTSGSMTLLSIDGWNPLFVAIPAISGAAKYVRLQAMHTHFWKVAQSSVLGVKGRVGWTYLFNDSNSFVPQDRQFFAGGANSVRAWSSRQLRYYGQTTTFNRSSIDDFSKNYIGSKVLIEGSIELRQKIGNIPGISESLAWLFDGLSIGIFLDFGNTFGWYADDTYIEFTDYFTKLAVGTGFGIRYDTPIGPIRLDLGTPIYDPTNQRKIFSNFVLQFGIGHAF